MLHGNRVAVDRNCVLLSSAVFVGSCKFLRKSALGYVHDWNEICVYVTEATYCTVYCTGLTIKLVCVCVLQCRLSLIQFV